MTNAPRRERVARAHVGREYGTYGASSHGQTPCGPGGIQPWDPMWRPLAGAALLERLRVTGRPRPAASAALAADLRALIEPGLDDLSSAVDGDRLVVTKDRLTRALSCPVHRTADRFGGPAFSVALACGAMVDALFRQVVTSGVVGDPWADALGALAVDGHQSALLAWIGELSPADRDELRSEVERQSEGLVARWPTLEPTWLPRTQESLRAALAGGSIGLSARVDLAIGPPAGDEASVAIVEVKSGVRRPVHRDDLRFYALVETLRSQAPPFAVATYYSRTGELDVEPVGRDLLLGSARRCLAGIRALGGVVDESVADGSWCAGCAGRPRSTTVVRRTGDDATVVDTTAVTFPHGQAA